MEKQIIELQEMLAHQQAEMAKMSDELFAQQREIEQLKRKLKRLDEQVEQVSDAQGDGGGYEPPPPHY